MNLNRTGIFSIALLSIALSIGPAEVSARIKCWTNKDGVRECGNTVPPEYAQQGHEEKSASGVTRKKTTRAKTDEELRKERAERERLAITKAEEERKRKIQAEKDRVLLATFTTEEDMLLTRNGQMASIDSRIKHAERTVTKLQASLKTLRSDAANQELAGKKISPKLQATIASVKKQMTQNLDFIEQRHKDKHDLEARYTSDLARYRELKGTTAQ